MQITSAMKMVSAAKLRRAQDAITQMRPYAVKLQGMLANVSASLEQGEGQYSEVRDVKRVLIVAITSNRGLCGAFNNNVVKLALEHIQQLKFMYVSNILIAWREIYFSYFNISF